MVDSSPWCFVLSPQPSLVVDASGLRCRFRMSLFLLYPSSISTLFSYGNSFFRSLARHGGVVLVLDGCCLLSRSGIDYSSYGTRTLTRTLTCAGLDWARSRPAAREIHQDSITILATGQQGSTRRVHFPPALLCLSLAACRTSAGTRTLTWAGLGGFGVGDNHLGDASRGGLKSL
jgi:hypothetical protein